MEHKPLCHQYFLYIDPKKRHAELDDAEASCNINSLIAKAKEIRALIVQSKHTFDRQDDAYPIARMMTDNNNEFLPCGT